jgi:CHAD domain-containing protein
MTTLTQSLDAGEGRDAGEIVGALGSRFEVVATSTRLVRRLHLDTFDRRLGATGLRLEHEVAGRERQLVLRRAGAPPMTVSVGRVRWPALADTLPTGPLRELVIPVTGIRALIVVGDEERRLRKWDLHNRDGKTVARVELDEPVLGVGATAQVTLFGLRGYDNQVRRATGLLVGLGLRPLDDTPAGPRAAPPPMVVIDPDAAATVLLADVLTGFATTMRENLPGLLDDVDTEFLHGFRVALRRTRSTVKAGRPVLPAAMRTRWEPEFRWLGAMTTPVRDLDVYTLGLPTMTAWLVAADPDDLDPLAAHLRRRRGVERRAMVRGLRSPRFERLTSDWGIVLDELADVRQVGEPESASVGQLAARCVSRAYEKVERDGAVIAGDSPAQDLHRLRGRCKELRYALEVFAPVIDVASRKRAVGHLQALQDVLGRFQDAEVQSRALREFATEMMHDGTPAATLLAMGELIAHLDAEQGRARHDFHQAFAGFADSPGRVRVSQSRVQR